MSKTLLRLCGGALLLALSVSPSRAQELTQSPTPSPEPSPGQQVRPKSQEEQLFERRRRVNGRDVRAAGQDLLYWF